MSSKTFLNLYFLSPPPNPANGFGIESLALSASPLKTPIPLFTGDCAAAALYRADSRSSSGLRCIAPTSLVRPPCHP